MPTSHDHWMEERFRDLAFPDLHRELRNYRGLTLGAVARALECSVGYVSDVERARRAPYDEKRLANLAQLFAVPADVLIDAALITRDQILETDGTDREHREVALALARSWKQLSRQAIAQIRETVISDTKKEV